MFECLMKEWPFDQQPQLLLGSFGGVWSLHLGSTLKSWLRRFHHFLNATPGPSALRPPAVASEPCGLRLVLHPGKASASTPKILTSALATVSPSSMWLCDTPRKRKWLRHVPGLTRACSDQDSLTGLPTKRHLTTSPLCCKWAGSYSSSSMQEKTEYSLPFP